MNNYNKQTTTTLQQLADSYIDQFEYAKRIDGRRFLRTANNASDNVLQLVDLTHRQFSNDDCTYCFLYGILHTLTEYSNLDEIELDIYPSQVDVINWLSSDLRRSEYVNEAWRQCDNANDVENFNIFEVLRQGYILELFEVYDIVIDFMINKL